MDSTFVKKTFFLSFFQVSPFNSWKSSAAQEKYQNKLNNCCLLSANLKIEFDLNSRKWNKNCTKHKMTENSDCNGDYKTISRLFRLGFGIEPSTLVSHSMHSASFL